MVTSYLAAWIIRIPCDSSLSDTQSTIILFPNQKYNSAPSSLLLRLFFKKNLRIAKNIRGKNQHSYLKLHARLQDVSWYQNELNVYEFFRSPLSLKYWWDAWEQEERIAPTTPTMSGSAASSCAAILQVFDGLVPPSLIMAIRRNIVNIKRSAKKTP